MTATGRWQVSQLAEHCEASAFGPRFSADFYSAAGNVAVIRTTDLDDAGNVNYGTVPRARLDVSDFVTHLLRNGDLLVTRSGTCGIAAVFSGYTQPVIPGAFLIRFRLRPTLQPYFLKHYINSPAGQSQIQAIATGAVQKNLTSTAMLRMRVPIPPLGEQQAVVSVLDGIQASVDACRLELRLERERKAALMEHLFTHGTRGENTKQTDIGEIPEQWETTALADAARISSGGTPDRTKPEYWDGAIPWVKTGEIRYNTILATDERITQEGLDNSAARVYPKGTLLMAMYGQGVTRGRVAILGIDAAINQACAAITPHDGILISRFAFYYLQFTYERIRVLGHGANQKNMNSHLVGSILLPLPSVEEQEGIVEVLAVMDAKLDALEHEIGILGELFRTMLQQLLSGDLSAAILVTEEAG